MIQSADPQAEAEILYLAQGILQGPRADVLSQLRATGVGACLWQRQLRTDLLNWLATLPAEQLPHFRAEAITQTDIRRRLYQAFQAAHTPDGPLRTAFEEDILSLATLFQTVTPCERFNLRLEVIENDACRRFHIDRLRARMLCTYRGSATQFALARENGDLPVEPIAQLGTGDVGVMRGTLWPARDKSGVLHRSPPISGSGETRLLLVIDPWQDRPNTLH